MTREEVKYVLNIVREASVRGPGRAEALRRARKKMKVGIIKTGKNRGKIKYKLFCIGVCYCIEKFLTKSKSDTQISPFNSLSTNSLVVYTLTNDCCLMCGSLDQIAALIANASARYGASSLS